MVLKIDGLIKVYGATRAINGLDLKADAGDIIGVFGSRGSGKSTLVDIISGVTTVSDGNVYVDGKISVITCEDMLTKELTIKENIKMAFGFTKDKIVDDTIDELLKQSPVKLPIYPMGLTTFDTYVISIMKAAVIKPSLILIDDFFSKCGLNERDTLWKLLLNMVDNKDCTIIFTTDDKDNYKYARRAYHLSYGKLYEEIS